MTLEEISKFVENKTQKEKEEFYALVISIMKSEPNDKKAAELAYEELFNESGNRRIKGGFKSEGF